MRIKIAYLDYSMIFAGAERVLYTIIENIDKEKFEPYLLLPYPMYHHKRYMDLECKIHYLAPKLSWWMGSDRWEHPLRGSDLLKRSIMGFRLAHYLKNNDIKLLHVNLIRPDSLMWLLPAKQAGIKILGHFRSQATEWIPPVNVQKCFTKIVCVSEYSRSRFLTKGKHVESSVVYDSIDVKNFSPTLSKKEAKGKFDYSDDTKIMVSVGQLSPHKGHDNAIRAFAKISEKYLDLRLFIVGGGRITDLEDLESLAASLGVSDKVKFTGSQISNISEVYRAADLTLSLTKVGEAFGLVPFESSCVGTPFIAPSFGAVKEFIRNKENGLLVDTNNVDEIADCMDWVLSHYEEALAMNTKVHRIIDEQISPIVMMRNLEKEYNALL